MPLAPKPAKVAPSFFGHEGLERPAWFIGRPRSVVGIVEHFFDSLAQKFDVYISPWDGRELVLPNLFDEINAVLHPVMAIQEWPFSCLVFVQVDCHPGAVAHAPALHRMFRKKWGQRALQIYGEPVKDQGVGRILATEAIHSLVSNFVEIPGYDHPSGCAPGLAVVFGHEQPEAPNVAGG